MLQVSTYNEYNRMHVQYCEMFLDATKISPAVATGLVYGSVRFRCSFDFRVPDNEVRWYKDGETLDFGNHPRLSVMGNELVISMVDRLDSGQYRCGFSHENTTFMSGDASLVIAGGPEIKPSTWTVPTVGRTVEISCDVTGATTDHKFIWSREDGSSLKDHIASTRIDTPISTKLFFSFDGIKQSGVYVCKDTGSLDFQPYEKVGVVYQVGTLNCGTKFSVCPSSQVGLVCGGRCPQKCGFTNNQEKTNDALVCERAGPNVDHNGGYVVWTYIYQNATSFETAPQFLFV
ncbi:down syndrome cell adhesion molecule homolog [Elysia marginata]|uniref:Down syndrome cell adhesion molecule homolog n=1 Tax=Elysia marginata TaxID=1093978 RepID=A0AAV4EHY8_9GAST|nr:down syndrome cell adhesion molecule homolog [Elysia marginata]